MPARVPVAGAAPAAAPAQSFSAGGLNPLIAAANPLLNLVGAVRAMPSHPDPEALRQRLLQAMKLFEAAGRSANVPTQALATARYALCTLLDEAIAGTPWGGGGVWASKSLLVTFHNEAWGGEKFFLVLQKLIEDPRANLDLLELLCVCLALGFEGRYRVKEGGRAQLEALRDRLHETIRAQRGNQERDLSPHWQGVVDRRNPLARLVPLWVVGAVVGVLLVALHLAFSVSLNGTSDPVFATLHGIDVAAAVAPPPATVAVTAPARVRLATLLASDIAAERLSVQESDTRATVSLHGDGLFGSGSAEIESDYLPLLARVAEALKTYPGAVLIAGHTDDQRILSARFPSNWKLSLARANAVLRMLADEAGAPERFRAVGRGETEPLVANDTPAHRARNRRVDIIVTTAGAGT
jgi:type VI secretion system protein ImpK